MNKINGNLPATGGPSISVWIGIQFRFCFDAVADLDPIPVLRMSENQKYFDIVVDPGCLFRIPDPGSRIRNIQDPGSGSTSKSVSKLSTY
jgi:hypothetical protein